MRRERKEIRDVALQISRYFYFNGIVVIERLQFGGIFNQYDEM